MSFGLSREEAFEFREGTRDGMASGMDDPAARHERTTAMLRRVIEDRRVNPQDDVITELVESEIEEDGERHLLTDDDIYGFARLILTAGSGTTWRQLGILLVGLLREPALLDAVRDDRELLRRTIDEAVRWEPTDPIFRRLVTKDVELCGVDIPAGAVVEMNLGAGNRDPDAVGRSRPLRPVPHAEVEPRLRRRPARVPGHARGARRDVRRDERGARPPSELAVRPRRAERTDHRARAPRAQRHTGRLRVRHEHSTDRLARAHPRHHLTQGWR